MGVNKENTLWFRSDRVFRGIVLAVVFLLGIVLILFGQMISGFWSDFVGGVGVAFVTTSVLGVVLESHLKERLFTDIRREVAATLSAIQAQAVDAVHLNRLPSELLNVVRKTVTEVPIIERDIFATYEFKSVTLGRAKALRAEIKSSSIYQNLTDQWQPGEIYEGGVKLPDRFKRYSDTADAGFGAIGVEIIEGSSQPSPFNLDREGMKFYISEQEGVPIFSRDVQFSPNCQLKVTTVEIAYYELADFDSFSASKPSINMVVVASFPDAGFKVEGEPDHALIEFWEGDNVKGQWNVKGALLPGQGIQFWWEPIEQN